MKTGEQSTRSASDLGHGEHHGEHISRARGWYAGWHDSRRRGWYDAWNHGWHDQQNHGWPRGETRPLARSVKGY